MKKLTPIVFFAFSADNDETTIDPKIILSQPGEIEG